jgi:aromatic-L-amino-acid/L-tryptophan decarboxylase
MSQSELLQSIHELQGRIGQLEPTGEHRDQLLAQVSTHAHRYIDALARLNAYSADKSFKHDLSIDGHPRRLEDLLVMYRDDVEEKGLKPASGGHLGYIPGGGIYTAALADFLADVSNEYAGIYFGSPGAVTIEHEVIDWLKRVFSFPETAVGNLASGGSIANLIALTAARDFHEVKNERVEKSVIYLSGQVHHCIYKAIRIIGLEDAPVRYVRLQADHRMDPGHLKELVAQDRAAGLKPFLLVASAGTTDTGVIDPLDALGQIAGEEGLWYHIDAAYGGFFILLDHLKNRFKGIESADSLVIDPHKGLFLPYGVGAVLVKNREAVLHSHHYIANYMQDAFQENLPLNPADLSPELTKHFRGLRVWLPLQLHGIDPFVACLQEKIHLTTYFRGRLQELGFELGPEPDLSVSYFWWPAKNMEANAYNRRLMEWIHRDGRVFLSSTTIGDRFVIRMAILSFRTKVATIDRAIEMIAEGLKALPDR